MSPLREIVLSWAADLLAAGGPTLVFGVAGSILGGLLALGLALLGSRLLEWRRKGSVRVSSLAARGASRAEIARRTGLSQDAVGMLLHVRSVHRNRRNLPVPARIAASHRAEARRRNRDWNPQFTAVIEDGDEQPRGWRAARALPFGGSTSNRHTPAGQAV